METKKRKFWEKALMRSQTFLKEMFSKEKSDQPCETQPKKIRKRQPKTLIKCKN